MAYQLPGYTSGSLATLVRVGSSGGTNAGTGNISSAATLFGCVFRASYSQNVTGCVVMHTTVTGSPTGYRVDMYAVDSNGLPTGASLGGATYTPTASSANSVTFSAPVAVTAGTCYALVWSNQTATPASNTTGLQTLSEYAGNLHLLSSDTGTTWTASHRSSLHAVPVYSVAGADGFCMNTSLSFGNGLSLYNTSGSRKARQGLKVNFAHDVLLWKVTAGFASKVGSPTFSVGAEICSSTASLSTSDTTCPAAGFSNTSGAFEWSTPYRLVAGVDYYVVITPVGATAGDSSNNVLLSCSVPTVKPGTLGPVKDTYQSTASGNPSFSVFATRIPSIDLWVEVPGSGTTTRVYGSVG